MAMFEGGASTMTRVAGLHITNRASADHGSAAQGCKTSISMAFLVMCAEKILGFLRLFFVAIYV
jgi:hypothetical protein